MNDSTPHTPGGIGAEELMYLNYITNRGKVWQVNDIFGASGLITVLPDADGNGLGRMSVFEFKPIPLTEDWLKKFGFVWNYKDLAYWLDHNFHCRIYAQIDSKTSEVYVMIYTRSAHNDYTPIYIENNPNRVHHLQNIIFSLTGKHLTHVNQQH